MPSQKLAELYPDVIEVRSTENPLGIDIKAQTETINEELLNWADIIWTNNIPNFGINYLARVLGLTKERKKLFWFDTDDLLTELYEGHRLESVYKDQGLSEATKWVYNNSDLVTVTQNKFAQRIRPFLGEKTLLAVIKNAIDYKLPCWNAAKIEVPKNRFTRIGWAGGIHHEEDVKEFAGIPWLVNQKVGKEKVRWDFYGKPPLDPKNPEKWQHDVWANYEKIICRGFKTYKNYTINAAMNADQYGYMFSNMDVGIAPLQMNSFNDCYAKGQQVIMFDGTFKKVEDLRVDDLLMGPDSTPRKVLRLSNGINDMYEIVPNRGEPFKVTKNHILCLKTNDKNTIKWKNSKHKQYLNITVEDYLKLPKSVQYNYRLYKCPNITFENTSELPLDPYFVGIMLGDGTMKGTPAITTADTEIKEYFESYCTTKYPELKIQVDQKSGNKASTYHATKIKWDCHIHNPIMQDLDKIGLKNVVCGDKFIPHIYKTGLWDARARLLAGLIDAGGTLQKCKTVFSFSNKSKQLVEDTAYVARSLGLYASPIVAFTVPTICDTTYYRTHIAGDLTIIPCKLERKKGQTRKVNRNHLTSGFKVNYVGKEEFFGFELNLDHMHLLDDFTVAHNSKSDIKVAELGRYKVPLICSNVGCYNETIIDGKTGFLVEPGPNQAKRWSECLTKLIKNKDLREEMGNNLHQVTEEYYDINKVVHYRLDFLKYYYDHILLPQSNT